MEKRVSANAGSVDTLAMALFIQASRTMSEYLDGKRIERLAEWQQHVRKRMDEPVDICVACWVLGDVVLVRGDDGSYLHPSARCRKVGVGAFQRRQSNCIKCGANQTF